jgi:glycosyltransferase involved in cell wall biosynthesis
MRIAFVNTLYPPYGGSGAEATLRILAMRLAACGHDCTILTLSPSRFEEERKVDGIPVLYLPLDNLFWPHGGHRPPMLGPLFQLLDAYNPLMRQRFGRALARFHPDVVHCHNLLGFSVSAWAAADALGIPVVQTLHDYNLACPRGAMWRPKGGNCNVPCAECWMFATPRRALSHVPYAITSVSHRVLDRVAAAGVFRKVPRARVIRGNNLEEDATVGGSQPTPNHGPLRLGFLGRLHPAKGLEILFDALAALPPSAVTLHIAGRGAPDYEAALRTYGAPHVNVKFLGHVVPADFFPKIDLLVIPSVWEDPFPRVFHEALAYGVPSLVSPLGGLPEVIEHGRTGFIAPSATAEGLCEALETLLSGAWDSTAMRRACLSAAQAYTPGRIGDQYEAVLTAAALGSAIPEYAGEPWLHSRSTELP